MPRHENIGDVVDAWYNATNRDGASTFDLCRECSAEYSGVDLEDIPLTPYGNGEPSGELCNGGVDHPDYDDAGMEYVCEVCDKKLTERRDG